MQRLGVPAVLALVAAAFVVLLGLGVWQLMRNAEKQDLTRERDAAIAAPPVAVDAVSAADPGIDWRRVTLEGEWDYEHAQIVGNRMRFALRGEDVYVPLLPPGGGPAILVNRGWYPAAERESVLATLPANEPAEGLVRLQTSGSAHIVDGAWTRYDLDAIAAALPYEVAPLRVLAGELVENPPLQLPPERPVTGYEGFHNTTPHVEYALTWFGLAAALLVTAAARIWQRRRGLEVQPRPAAHEGSTSDGHEVA